MLKVWEKYGQDSDPILLVGTQLVPAGTNMQDRTSGVVSTAYFNVR
jgi:hypothetical protein